MILYYIYIYIDISYDINYYIIKYCAISYYTIKLKYILPVVPHKAVAEVSNIGNL